MHMPRFSTTRTVPHTAGNMFDLVADVEKYPEFLPLCTGLSVRRREEDGDGNEVLIADMSVGYKAIRERFTSRVTLNRTNCRILVEYVDGPFSHLENIWEFRDADGSEADSPQSQVRFRISYEFRSRMLGMVMGGMFDRAFRKFAEAFEQRADRIYGRPPVAARRSASG